MNEHNNPNPNPNPAVGVLNIEPGAVVYAVRIGGGCPVHVGEGAILHVQQPIEGNVVLGDGAQVVVHDAPQ